MPLNLRLGEILIKNNLLKASELREGLERQRGTSLPLGESLLDLGYIGEKELAWALGKQAGVPFLNLKKYRIPEENLKYIPLPIVEKYLIVPLEKRKDTIVLALANPKEQSVLDLIFSLSGLKASPFVSTKSELLEAITKYYGPEEKRLRLGKLLVNNKVITEEQLQKGLEEQKVERKYLGETLVKLGFVSEDELVKFLGKFLTLSVMNLEECQLDFTILKLVPGHIARERCVLPLEKNGHSLLVAMADPLNTLNLVYLQSITKSRIRIVLSSRASINRAIDHFYGPNDFQETLSGILKTQGYLTSKQFDTSISEDGLKLRDK